MGRANRADFKLIAKALTRAGNAYKQQQVGGGRYADRQQVEEWRSDKRRRGWGALSRRRALVDRGCSVWMVVICISVTVRL